jgi:hypothetical protein
MTFGSDQDTDVTERCRLLQECGQLNEKSILKDDNLGPVSFATLLSLPLLFPQGASRSRSSFCIPSSSLFLIPPFLLFPLCAPHLQKTSLGPRPTSASCGHPPQHSPLPHPANPPAGSSHGGRRRCHPTRRQPRRAVGVVRSLTPFSYH